jgi:hypothetical protein
MTALASCHVCGGLASRAGWVIHKPGCALRSTDTDCREPDDLARPCRFAGNCHAERRSIAVHAGLRGANCWAWQAMTEKQGDTEVTAEREEMRKA